MTFKYRKLPNDDFEAFATFIEKLPSEYFQIKVLGVLYSGDTQEYCLVPVGESLLSSKWFVFMYFAAKGEYSVS